MCTVTFLPLPNNGFILTSNRDETPLRKTIPPKGYLENGVEVVYPKDVVAGGTWIGTSEKNRAVCLLNGAYKNHKRTLPYALSRGVIVKNVLTADDAEIYINRLGLHNIEPFTLLLLDYSVDLKLFELVWDGETKHIHQLDKTPRIWSSSTLYTSDMKEKRQEWFQNWLKENDQFSVANILEFHNNTDLGEPEVTTRMKRKLIETVSITSISKIDEIVDMKYLDFL